MHKVLSSTSLVHRASPATRLAFVALSVCLVALLAAFTTIAVQATFASAVAPFTPTVEEGHIPDGTVVSLADEGLPTIARLNPALRDALRRAEADAAADGLRFEVTSGWRSSSYQQWLLDDAVHLYASEEIARQFVATPEHSSHVTGDAVDIAPVDAQFWLIEHGTRYGICQTYANERWHFELATEPGGVCPAMKTDARG